MDLSSEPCAFPELLGPDATAMLVGVDPDVNGALATLRWRNAGALAGASALQLAAAAEVEIHDMPVEIWKLGKRDKRHPDAAALDALLRSLAARQTASGSGLVRAVVEYSTPQHLSGKHAWYGIGFSTGLFSALLASLGLPYQRVSAVAWKRQMGLFRQGKEGSRALAAQLFPDAAERYLRCGGGPRLCSFDFICREVPQHDSIAHATQCGVVTRFQVASCRRKKDHGRAEALLIAAWALGVRASVPDPGEVEQAGEEAETEGSDSKES
jgi:hypothetical protein